MARLWADGFDHYGTTEGFMLDNVYANASGELSTTQVATGTHSFYHNQWEIGGSQLGLRRVVPNATTSKIGVMSRYWFDVLPTNNTLSILAFFGTSDVNVAHIALVLDTSGSIRCYRGYTNHSNPVFHDEGTLLFTTDPLVTSGAFNHFEFQVNISNTAGWVRIALNGDTAYESDTNLDTLHGSYAGYISHVSHGHGDDGSPALTGPFYQDDLIVYDFTGTAATDTDFCPAVDGSGYPTEFIGELQCVWTPTDGDTAEEDWVPSTGTDSSAMVDEVDPNDADFLTSSTAGDLTEFELDDLPPEITYIRGVDLWARLDKSDAGPAKVQLGVKSVAATSDSDPFSITTVPSYWIKQKNVDPNSSARWTRASYNAAKFRLTRES